MADYQPRHFKTGTAPAPHGGGILIVYGEPGVGKTQFCVETADVGTPLYMCNFDRDAAHLLKKYKGEGGIYYEDFMALTKQQAEACLDKATASNTDRDKGSTCILPISTINKAPEVFVHHFACSSPGNTSPSPARLCSSILAAIAAFTLL